MGPSPHRYLRRVAAPDPEVDGVRILAFAGVLALIFVALAGRLWYLQVVRGEEYRAQAARNQTNRVRIVAPRGTIVDQKGRLLVSNGSQISVFVIPDQLPRKAAERKAVFDRLAAELGWEPKRLDDLYRRRKTRPSDPVTIAEGVNQHTLARLAESDGDLRGVVPQIEPVRHYPRGTLAAQLLGHLGPVDVRDLANPELRARGYRGGDFTGKNGVEKQYDALLCGREGSASFEVDAVGRRRREIGVTDPVPGARLTLTIDLEVQQAAEKALAGKPGAIVALDPRNGRILALASYPTFDPNLMAHRPLSGEVYAKRVEPGLRNRVIFGGAAPGSTFKIVTSAAGLGEGLMSEHAYAFCPGGKRVGNRWFSCHKKSGHGGVSLKEAMAQSCDVFYYTHGVRIGPEKIAHWARQFGLDERTGIDLPGEMRSTIVPDPEWRRRYVQRVGAGDPTWYDGHTANLAIGQGELRATPLQMCLVAAAVANGGAVVRPHVLQRAVAQDSAQTVRFEDDTRPMRRLDLTPQQVAILRDDMRAVVTSGTARVAQIPGLFVAGKTGTAQVRERRNGKRLPREAADAWFVGFASRPNEEPTIAVCVYRESFGGNLHGGSEAAPLFRKVIAAHFGIRDATSALDGAPTRD